MPDETGDLLPTPDAAGILGIERSTLSRWVDRGVIQPAMRLPGLNGPMLFDRADVEALKEQITRDGFPRKTRAAS